MSTFPFTPVFSDLPGTTCVHSRPPRRDRKTRFDVQELHWGKPALTDKGEGTGEGRGRHRSVLRKKGGRKEGGASDGNVALGKSVLGQRGVLRPALEKSCPQEGSSTSTGGAQSLAGAAGGHAASANALEDPARQELSCHSATLPTAGLSGAFPWLLQRKTKQGVWEVQGKNELGMELMVCPG